MRLLTLSSENLVESRLIVRRCSKSHKRNWKKEMSVLLDALRCQNEVVGVSGIKSILAYAHILI
jgi:hypothetical protein